MALRSVAQTVLPGLGLSWRAAASELAYTFSRAAATVASDVKYAVSHEWAKVDGDVATVGISDFAQSELGDVVYVELPQVGSTFSKGETFGVVESVKAASDVYAPVSGEVIEVNGALADEPAKVNQEPFGDGWIMKLKISSPKEVDALLTPSAYQAECDKKH